MTHHRWSLRSRASPVRVESPRNLNHGISVCMAAEPHHFETLRRCESTTEGAWNRAIRECEAAQATTAPHTSASGSTPQFAPAKCVWARLPARAEGEETPNLPNHFLSDSSNLSWPNVFPGIRRVSQFPGFHSVGQPNGSAQQSLPTEYHLAGRTSRSTAPQPA